MMETSEKNEDEEEDEEGPAASTMLMRGNVWDAAAAAPDHPTSCCITATLVALVKAGGAPWRGHIPAILDSTSGRRQPRRCDRSGGSAHANHPPV